MDDFPAIDDAVPPRTPLHVRLAQYQPSPVVECSEMWFRTIPIVVVQAKKREKKKNAAKDPVPVDPAKKAKVLDVSGVNEQGVGVDGGKNSPVSKRAGGAGKNKGGRVTVQRSQVLGKKVRWVCSVLGTKLMAM